MIYISSPKIILSFLIETSSGGFVIGFVVWNKARPKLLSGLVLETGKYAGLLNTDILRSFEDL